ncbi:hypothetical protein [Hymenobacter rubripertinctus]|nr:hypothetical protein [Hymenobacter rubripertinctus]
MRASYWWKSRWPAGVLLLALVAFRPDNTPDPSALFRQLQQFYLSA